MSLLETYASELTELRATRRAQNPHPPYLDEYGGIEVQEDPHDWFAAWAVSIVAVLDAQPVVARAVKDLSPKFIFDVHRESWQQMNPDTVFVPSDVDPSNSTLGQPTYLRWWLLRRIGVLLYDRAAYQERYEQLFERGGPLGHDATAEQEVGQLFYLAATDSREANRDLEIMLSVSPDGAERRFGWMLHVMLKPYLTLTQQQA